MPDVFSTAPASTGPYSSLANSRYELFLYESNLFDQDVHQITGVATPGLHKRVLPIISAENFSLNILLNRPGSASFEVPLQSREAMMIAGYSVKRAVVVAVDGVPEWSGYIGNLSLTSGGNLSVNVLGWMQMLYGRELQQDLVFNTIDPGVIATRLLAATNNRVANNNTATVLSLVPNSNFERDAAGSTDASWQTGSDSIYNKYVTAGGAFKGNKFLRWMNSAVSLADSSATGCFSYVKTPVAAGQQFQFRLAVRYSTPGKVIQIALGSDATSTVYSDGVTSNGNWQVLQTPVLTAQVAATQLAISVSVFGSTDAGSTVDIDDAYLVDVNMSAAAEDLMGGNGYFEGYLPAAADIASYLGSVSLSDIWVRAGSRSLYVTAPTKTTAYLGLGPAVFPAGIGVAGNPYGSNALFPVNANSTYLVHFWLNVTSANLSFGVRPTVSTYMNFYDENKIFIAGGPASSSHNTPGIYEVSDIYTVPSNAAYAAIYIATVAGAEHRLKFYIDCMTITEGTSPGLKPLPIQPGVVDAPAGPVKRTRTYRVSEKVGNSIEELSNIESGFDWEVATLAVDQSFSPISGNLMDTAHTMLRRMNVKYGVVKAGTTIRGIGQDRPDIVFGLGREPENMLSLVEQQDISKIVTRFAARSAGRSAMAQDIAAMMEFGLWDESTSISDAGISSSALLAYAGGEVVYRGRPVKSWQPTLKPWDGSPNKPKFWTNFRAGDIGYLSAEDGALVTAERQPIRIFGLTITLDPQGNENLGAFQTMASS